MIQLLRKSLPFLFLFLLVLSLSSHTAEDSLLSELQKDPHLALRALDIAYPDAIDSIDYDVKNNDWAITMGNIRLFWAHGRLLPQEEIQNWQKWRALIDYLYPKEIPDPKNFSKSLIEQIKSESHSEQRNNAPIYNPVFYDALYDGLTRRKIESHITRFDYLGLRVSVHKAIVPALKRVEKSLNEIAKENSEVAMFIQNISSIDGYNWREIADSPSRSNHSWGIAIDILPKNWGNKNIYWNWISWWNKDWMLIPLERRWMPPLEVIKVFEEEGFIWGGKWHLWDTMHFEYRPELLVLQRWGF